MDILNILFVVMIAVVAIAALFFLIGYLIPPPQDKVRSAYKVQPQQSQEQDSSTSTTATKSYAWLWWVAAVVAVLAVGWWGYNHFQSGPAPRVKAPTEKRALKEKVSICDLKFVGGDNVSEAGGLVYISSGGHAFFATKSLPWRNDAEYRIAVYLIRRSTGNVILAINGGRGGEKFYMHPGSPNPAIDVYFETGEKGNPSFFNPGANQVKIYSPGDDIFIQRISIVMIHRE